MTWTGFSGAEIKGFFGDPTKLFIKPEKPDFFLSMPGTLDSLPSPECLLLLDELLSDLDVFSLGGSCSADEKLADWRNDDAPMVLFDVVDLGDFDGFEDLTALESVFERDRASVGGGGAMRRGERLLNCAIVFVGVVAGAADSFVASIRLRMALPSNGAPISSSVDDLF